MGVKIVKTTDAKQKLKLISITDSAIDWDEMYLDQAFETKQEKEDFYRKDYKIQDLKFLDGDTPTLFVFEHPKRQDIASRIRDFFAKQERGRNESDMHTEVFNAAYIGTEEGIDGAVSPAPRRDGKITNDHLQALQDSNVFNELAQVVLTRMLTKTQTDDDKKK